ncbi:MAG TPA: AGE family epimerase/isomerase [Puia sp.]|nr:AGE family epimerase/isomerase [Puia sp.]
MENKAVLQAEFREELERILRYWERYTVDKAQGGFYGQLNNDNVVAPGAVKGAVLNARILWSFSAGYNLVKGLGSDPDRGTSYLTLAGRSLEYIIEHFVDKEYGGVYWSVTAEGAPADRKKQIYAMAFTIYGLTEYYRAQPMQEALDLAVRSYQDIETYSHDVERGGYMEALTRDWQPIADLRLSEKDANEKKTMNTHLHILEAYTNLYRVWQDPGLAGRIRELIGVFIDHIVDGRTYHLGLFFDEDWTVRSNIISYGHDIEASWLLLEAAEVLEDAELVRQVKELAVRIALASTGGLNPDGSMSYEYDRDKDHMVAERHWWVQAEAMVGFLNAAQLTGEAHFFRKFKAVWEYTRQSIVDREKGEWFWGRRADGAIMEGQDKVGSWKCPYHNSRACIEVIRRLGER